MYDVNFVDTYFEKGNVEDLVKEAVAKENIGEIGFYYIDKKKAANLLQGPGYQLPQHLASRLTASNTIIRKIDANVNRKISDFTQTVVTENYEMTPTLELAYAITGYLKTHLHNINLDHIKGEIILDIYPFLVPKDKSG